VEGDVAETTRKLPERGSRRISPQEIQDVLADDGYAAGDRKEWLKSVLTDLTGEAPGPDGAGPERERLIEAIKTVIDENQEERPISGDLL
jgi:hypothetical protein